MDGDYYLPNYQSIKHMAIVYTWVNGTETCYQEKRKSAGGRIGGSRDREVGELMHSLRTLEKFMPWHKGPIYIVTPGHVPYWLNLNDSRISVVNQDDLFPESRKKFLPTFNTNAIEQFLYRIPGLTDIFMQINDDQILTDYVSPHVFFGCRGEIKFLFEKSTMTDSAPKESDNTWLSGVLNTNQEIQIAFGRLGKTYTSTWGRIQASEKYVAPGRRFLKHAPFVYSRKAFARLHEIFERPLYNTLRHKFRHKEDM